MSLMMEEELSCYGRCNEYTNGFLHPINSSTIPSSREEFNRGLDDSLNQIVLDQYLMVILQEIQNVNEVDDMNMLIVVGCYIKY